MRQAETAPPRARPSDVRVQISAAAAAAVVLLTGCTAVDDLVSPDAPPLCPGPGDDVPDDVLDLVRQMRPTALDERTVDRARVDGAQAFAATQVVEDLVDPSCLLLTSVDVSPQTSDCDQPQEARVSAEERADGTVVLSARRATSGLTYDGCEAIARPPGGFPVVDPVSVPLEAPLGDRAVVLDGVDEVDVLAAEDQPLLADPSAVGLVVPRERSGAGKPVRRGVSEQVGVAQYWPPDLESTWTGNGYRGAVALLRDPDGQVPQPPEVLRFVLDDGTEVVVGAEQVDGGNWVVRWDDGRGPLVARVRTGPLERVPEVVRQVVRAGNLLGGLANGQRGRLGPSARDRAGKAACGMATRGLVSRSLTASRKRRSCGRPTQEASPWQP